VRLLTWNILHGGGPKRLPEIILSLLAHQPDVIVLTEFRVTRGSSIRAVLNDHGLEFHHLARSPERVNGTLLASRTPLVPVVLPGAPGNGRWAAASLPEHGHLTVAGVHVPDDADPPAKKAYWEFLLSTGELWKTRDAVILGDFNTSRRGLDGGPKSQRCSRQLESLLKQGYVDAYRSCSPETAEFSWFSHEGQGWRIDTAFLSPPLQKRLQRAWYSQVEREAKHSDHAPLLVDLEPLVAMRTGECGLGEGVEKASFLRHKAGLFGGAASPAG
jgi:exonuclease III